MIFHGDGAANIENADSLNWYGFLVYWDLIQKLLDELSEKNKRVEKKLSSERCFKDAQQDRRNVIISSKVKREK